MIDQLNAIRIKQLIKSNDLPNVRVFEQIGSTNDYSLENHLVGNHVVIADHQTKGRGQRGHSFYSPKGSGFYMTTTFRASERFIKNPGLLTAGVALAVIETFQPYISDELGIKWINDIYRNGRKCGGILIETNTSDVNEIESFVIGVGLNLYTKEFPDAIKSRAGYLFDDLPNISRNRMMAEFYDNLAEIYYRMSPQTIIAEYLDHMIWLNQIVNLKAFDQTLTGAILGIDDYARLIVLDDKNRKHYFNYLDASQVRLI